MSQSWNKTPGINIEQLLGLGVWINLYVLIWDPFNLEGNPHSLDEWTIQSESTIS